MPNEKLFNYISKSLHERRILLEHNLENSIDMLEIIRSDPDDDESMLTDIVDDIVSMNAELKECEFYIKEWSDYRWKK